MDFDQLQVAYAELLKEHEKLKNFLKLKEAFASKYNMDFMSYLCPEKDCQCYRFHEDRNNRIESNCETMTDLCNICNVMHCLCHGQEPGAYTADGNFACGNCVVQTPQ